MRTTLQWDSLFYYMPPSVNTNDDIKLAPAPTPVPAVRAAGMQKKISLLLLHFRPKGSLCHALAQDSFCIF